MKACIEKNCEITIADKTVNNTEVKNANFIEVDITSLEDMQAKLIDDYDYILILHLLLILKKPMNTLRKLLTLIFQDA